jgi:hypothetical protein
MKIAHKRDAVLNEKFWFRKNVFGSERSDFMNDGMLNVIFDLQSCDNDNLVKHLMRF